MRAYRIGIVALVSLTVATGCAWNLPKSLHDEMVPVARTLVDTSWTVFALPHVLPRPGNAITLYADVVEPLTGLNLNIYFAGDSARGRVIAQMQLELVDGRLTDPTEAVGVVAYYNRLAFGLVDRSPGRNAAVRAIRLRSNAPLTVTAFHWSAFQHP